MCPGTLAITAAAMSAAGALTQGIASGNAANYQAQVASNNRTIQKQNAAYSASAGAAATEEAGLKARAKQAGVRAGIAANGLDVNTGSAADVQSSQRMISNLDTANVANRSALQVYGYETQASNDQAQANLDRSQATSDYLSGGLKAGATLAGSPSVQQGFSSLLSGPSSLPSNYQWMAQPDSGQAAGLGDFGFG